MSKPPPYVEDSGTTLASLCRGRGTTKWWWESFKGKVTFPRTRVHGVPPYEYVRTHKKPSPVGEGGLRSKTDEVLQSKVTFPRTRVHGVPPYEFVRTHKKPSPEGKGDRSRWMRGAKSVQTIVFLNILQLKTLRPPTKYRLTVALFRRRGWH